MLQGIHTYIFNTSYVRQNAGVMQWVVTWSTQSKICCICIDFFKVLYMHLGNLSAKFAVLNKLLLEVWKGYALMLVINSLLSNTYAKLLPRGCD